MRVPSQSLAAPRSYERANDRKSGSVKVGTVTLPPSALEVSSSDSDFELESDSRIRLITLESEAQPAPESQGGLLISSELATEPYPRTVENETVYQVLVPLTAEQIGRLWLRERSLGQNNVYVWAQQTQRWVPVFRVQECATQIARARVDSIRMLSSLCLGRASTTLAPPMRNRLSLTGHAPDSEGIGFGNLALPPYAPQTVKTASNRLARTRDFVKRSAFKCLQVCEEIAYALRGISMKNLRRALRRLRIRFAFLPYAASVSFVFALALSYYSNRAFEERSRALSTGANPAPRVVNAATLEPIYISAPAVTPSAALSTPDAHPSSNPTVDSKIRRATPTAHTKPEQASHRNFTARTSNSPSAAPPAAMTDREFNLQEARRAIDWAIERAHNCAASDIRGKFLVTFSASGSVASTTFTRFSGDAAQRTCILAALGRMRISPFAGEAVTLSKSFSVRERGT